MFKLILNLCFITLVLSEIDPGANKTGNQNISYAGLNSIVNPDRVTVLEWLSSWGWPFYPSTTEKPEILEKPEKCPICKCGLPNVRKRIVGGSETKVNQYPWMTMLIYNGRFYCGGTLITDLHILTAAHCVNGFEVTNLSIRLMEHDRNLKNETETITRKIKKIYRHPRYNTYTFNNDMAILKMDSRVKLENNLRTACLPLKGETYAGQTGTVTGWGATEQFGSIAVQLREVDVPILTNEECQKTGYGSKRITDNMLCAGYPEGKKDACQGDSGGPLHVKEDYNGIHRVVGVVSWGEGCAEADYPGVYTRVNRYLNWIKTNTADGCFCSEPSEEQGQSIVETPTNATQSIDETLASTTSQSIVESEASAASQSVAETSENKNKTENAISSVEVTQVQTNAKDVRPIFPAEFPVGSKQFPRGFLRRAIEKNGRKDPIY